jgi:tRNA uridine 5-carboxymethylaminomethyl modification enzyme
LAHVPSSTGTFLRGRIHIGTETKIAGSRAGKVGGNASGQTAGSCRPRGGTLQTGRRHVDGRSVDFERLERQTSEIEAFDFSWSHFWKTRRRWGEPGADSCWITFLSSASKDIIQEKIASSAMYGAIASRGPRYCPSVEDKIVRFPAAGSTSYSSPAGHGRRVVRERVVDVAAGGGTARDLAFDSWTRERG